MKKAFMLAGLVLCTTAGFAAESQTNLIAEGKKRNEAAYEQILEQTGWKSEKSAREEKSTSQNADERTASQSKSG